MSAPLTPEEILKGTLPFPDPNSDSGISILCLLFEAYAVQQTAEKDERIKELEEQRKILIEQHDGKDVQIKAKDARIAQLEVDNKALQALINNNDAQYKARIAVLESDLEIAQNGASASYDQAKIHSNENKLLLEKVEHLKSGAKIIEDANDNLRNKVEQLEKDLSEARQQRNTVCNEYSDLKATCDKAFDLLEQWKKREPAPQPKKFSRISTSVLRERDTLLSSREMKHAVVDNDEILKLHVETLSSRENKNQRSLPDGAYCKGCGSNPCICIKKI